MRKKGNSGVGRPGTSDSTSKKFGENVKKMLDSYSNSDLMEKDFKLLKSSERIKFLQDMAPYLMPKLKSEPDKEPRNDDKDTISRLLKIYPDLERTLNGEDDDD